MDELAPVIQNLKTGGLRAGVSAIVIADDTTRPVLLLKIMSDLLLYVTNITIIRPVGGSNFLWTQNLEAYYSSLWSCLGVNICSDSVISVKASDDDGWIDSVRTSSGITIKGNLVVVASSETSNEKEGAWSGQSWQAYGKLDGKESTIVEYNVQDALEKQKQSENERQTSMTRRRRDALGFSEPAQSTLLTVSNPKFGAYFISEDNKVVGAFLVGMHIGDKEFVKNIVKTGSSWPLP